jgi:hypothetical protein
MRYLTLCGLRSIIVETIPNPVFVMALGGVAGEDVVAKDLLTTIVHWLVEGEEH